MKLITDGKSYGIKKGWLMPVYYDFAFNTWVTEAGLSCFVDKKRVLEAYYRWNNMQNYKEVKMEDLK